MNTRFVQLHVTPGRTIDGPVASNHVEFQQGQEHMVGLVMLYLVWGTVVARVLLEPHPICFVVVEAVEAVGMGRVAVAVAVEAAGVIMEAVVEYEEVV